MCKPIMVIQIGDEKSLECTIFATREKKNFLAALINANP